MKGMSKMDINMVVGCRFLRMEIVMKDYTLMVNLKVMDYIVGKMEQYIEGSSKMV